MGRNFKIEVILSAKDTGLSSGIGKATKGLQTLQNQARSLSSMKLSIGGILGGGAAAYYANQVRLIADEYTNLNSRLKLVTNGEQELSMVQERLFQISQKTGTEYAANADSYAKLARTVKDFGGTSEETLQITDLVNKSLTINGSSSAMASSFMLQFAQAMGSGVLQGDEFRAMLESNGFFASELAKALGTDIAGLRQMSKDGELTSNKLRTAFPKMAVAINAEFNKIEPTVGRALTMLQNSYKRIIDESNKASNGTGTVSQSLIELAQTIDEHREGIISLFTHMISLASKTVSAVANIGQSFAGWDAVFGGKLSFFEFATMDAKELNEWLKKNVQSLKETGAAGKKAGAEVAASAQQSASVQKQATGEALKEMKKQYQDYAKEVRKLQDDISGRGKSLSAELRELSRTGMSDVSAWRDQRKEAQEYEAAAKKAAKEAQAAMEAGDTIAATQKWKDAVSYADSAKSAYKELNTEVKSGEQIVISQQEALKVSMAGVKSSGELAIGILKQQQAATVGAMNSLTEKSGFADLTKGMTDAENQWLTSWENMKNAAGEKIAIVKQQIEGMADGAEQVKTKLQSVFSDPFQLPENGDWGKVWESMESGSNSAARSVTSDWDGVWDKFLSSGSDDISSLNKQLAELIKDRHMKIYVEKVEKNRFGGLVGGYQTGGIIQRLARGGKLPGYGGGDTVPALLEAGEFVVRKEAVSRYGVAYLQALNAMRLNDFNIVRARIGGVIATTNNSGYQRFQQGGQVAIKEPMETINLNLTLPGSERSIPMKIGPEQARQLQNEFARMHRMRS